MNNMTLAALVVLIVLLSVGLYDVWETKRLIRIGTGLADAAIPYRQNGTNPKILVIGDSTAVGTGASSSSTSLAGLLGQHYSSASIENHGVNGARTADLPPRLQKLDNDYDLLIIHIGGNDTVHFTNLSELQKSLDQVIKLAKERAKNIVIVSTGNVGTARLLPFGTRWAFSIRTRQVRDIFIKAAVAHNVTYVDLYRQPSADPFAQNPSKYYAIDSFHPSDAGYVDWFSLIVKKLPQL